MIQTYLKNGIVEMGNSCPLAPNDREQGQMIRAVLSAVALLQRETSVNVSGKEIHLAGSEVVVAVFYAGPNFLGCSHEQLDLRSDGQVWSVGIRGVVERATCRGEACEENKKNIRTGRYSVSSAHYQLRPWPATASGWLSFLP